MATYVELTTLQSDTELRNKIEVAVAIAAIAIMGEADTVPNNVNRRLWAKEALAHPITVAQEMQWGAICANAGLTVAQIRAAPDTNLLAVVNSLVNLYATGV